jgi:2-(1,2-epoxy-1,2-dihydrophenyl)acetyl-CoA isomerase
MRELHQWLPELEHGKAGHRRRRWPGLRRRPEPGAGGRLRAGHAPRQFCAVFGRIGLVPDLGMLHQLPRIGLQKAKELVFTARTVEAEEAKQLGMVFDIVDDGAALPWRRAGWPALGDASTAAIGMAKTIMNQSFESDARTLAEMEAYAQSMCRGSPYHQEAIRRFKAKEPLRFDWDRAP